MTNAGIPPTVTPSLHVVPRSTQPDKYYIGYQNCDTLYAYDRSGSTGIIYKSTGRGQTWTQQGTINANISDAHLTRIEATGTLVLVLNGEQTGNADIDRSTDDGTNWTLASTAVTHQPLGPQSFAETPSGDFPPRRILDTI